MSDQGGTQTTINDAVYPRWLGPHVLAGVVTALVAALLLNGRECGLYLCAGVMCICLAGMAAVCAVMPSPPPLKDRSALAKRVGWMLKNIVSALVVGFSAVYGALVGIDMDGPAARSDPGGSHLLSLVGMPALLAGFLLAMGTLMALAFDLFRQPAEGREEAVVSAVRLIAVDLPEGLRRWLRDGLLMLVSPPVPFLVAYFALPVLGSVYVAAQV